MDIGAKDVKARLESHNYYVLVYVMLGNLLKISESHFNLGKGNVF